MADDIANLLHNSYGFPKTGKSAPMGSIKKGGVQSSQSKGGIGKSSGLANSDPIQDDAFSGPNGTFGSKSAGVGASYAVGDDPFYPGTVKSSPTYGDNDIFGMGSTGGAKGYSSNDDPFAMPGSFSSSPATTSFVDPFGGLGSMNSGPSGGAGAGTPFSGDDLLGGFGAGKARSSDTPERQDSQDPFQTLDPDPVFSTTPSLSTPPSSHPADANDPFSIPSPATSATAATSSSSNGHGHGGDAFSGLNDFLSAKPVSTSSGKSGGSGASPNVSFRQGNDDKESPQPSPHKHRGFFGRKKEEPPTPPAEEILKPSTVAQNVPGEDAWLTVEDLVLSLVTMPTSTPPPSRPPPPPGTQRRKPPPPPPPYQQAAPSSSSWQQPPKSEPPPSYAYAQQAPQSWPPPGSRRPSQPESTPNYTPPNKSTTPEAGPSNMDGFDAFGSGRSSDGKFSSPRSNQMPTPPSEPDKHDAEATAAAQAAASSSAQMAEAMERAKEKAGRARAAKEREDARRAREEAAERLRREAQAKTQRPVDTGFVNNDFFNAAPRRSESDPRMRPPPQSDFMSDPPRAPGGFSNLDDLGSVGGRRPAAPPAQPPKPTTPAPTPGTAATANDWADILGGGGGGGATSSSNTFQEIEGETAERRELRYQKWQNIQQRATEALAEKNRRDVEAQKEQNERSRADDLYANEIKRWAQGKEGNLIALLSTLQHVLWPECGWEPMSIADLISPAQVKKAYRKATLCVHPDKVQQKGANVHQKYIAEKVFDLLKEAWNKYNQNNLF